MEINSVITHNCRQCLFLELNTTGQKILFAQVMPSIIDRRQYSEYEKTVRLVSNLKSVFLLSYCSYSLFVALIIFIYLSAVAFRLFLIYFSFLFLTFTDTNECALDQTLCDQKCINNPGNYSCQCFKGFQYDSKNKKCVGELSNALRCTVPYHDILY